MTSPDKDSTATVTALDSVVNIDFQKVAEDVQNNEITLGDGLLPDSAGAEALGAIQEDDEDNMGGEEKDDEEKVEGEEKAGDSDEEDAFAR